MNLMKHSSSLRLIVCYIGHHSLVLTLQHTLLVSVAYWVDSAEHIAHVCMYFCQLFAQLLLSQTRTMILVSGVECLKKTAPVSQLQASGIHLVGVQLLDSIVASWRRCGNKGCRGIFTLRGSFATQRPLVFVFAFMSEVHNSKRHRRSCPSGFS